MATEQGICKNCGSLLMVNSSDEMCECVFCDCVFPSAEAIEIFNHPDGVEFPNLPQPKREGKVTRHVVTPVFEDVVEKAVKVDKATNKESKVEKLFELSPDDVKAPKKVKIITAIATSAAILIVLGISIPLFVLRMSHRHDIEKNLQLAITNSEMTVSLEKDDGFGVGYKIYGQTNKKLDLVASEDVNEEQVKKAFESYCAIRGEEYGYSTDDGSHYYDGVVLTVYAPNGRFTVEGNKNGAEEVEFYVPKSASEAAEEN